MSYFGQPLLLMFLGSPGSGKSYFARAVANKLNAVRINGDSMRLSMFGSREETERIYKSGNRAVLNDYVFNGLDYVAEQIIMRGHDVVYDAHHNKRTDREKLEEIAIKHNAKPILIWIRTPFEIALQRCQSRQDLADQRRLTEEKTREVIARHQVATDDPADEEFVINIDGQISFEEQFASFQTQLGVINDK